MIGHCRVIHGSFAPSVTGRDAIAAAALLFQPAKWRTGAAPSALESALSHRLDGREVTAVDSGRNALRLALQALGVRAGDEVLLQAFTCVSVPGPVLWLGAIPVWVDILAETYNMDPEDLRRKITTKSRAVIIQHTFGLPADLEPLLKIAREHNLTVIEDCAHALGSRYRGQEVGTFGDAAVFSFGRDKVISSVFGGAAVFRAKVENRKREMECSPRRWVARQLLHTATAPLLRATYFCGGRYALRALVELRILSKALTAAELTGGTPPLPPSQLANALALRALDQLSHLEEFSAHRQALAKHYTESLRDLSDITPPAVPVDRTHGFLRYAVRHPRRAALSAAAQRAGIILGEAWYEKVVAPRGTDLHAVHYTAGSCPRAEEAAATVVNLPTSPTLSLPDADRVLGVACRVSKQPR